MFGRGTKKEPAKKRNHDLSQFGIFDVPTDLNDIGDSDGDDSDLEAELAAISGSGGAKPRQKPKKEVVPAAELNRMVADSLKDVDDDDSDFDENDPDLLNELQGITVDNDNEPIEDASPPLAAIIVPTTSENVADLISSRLEMYRLAEQNAKAAGDSSKARRFNRGLKTLEGLLKQAKQGRPINPDDIPPEVVTKVAQVPADPPQSVDPPASTPVRTAPAPPTKVDSQDSTTPTTSNVNSEVLQALLGRKQEYVKAALEAKKSGDLETAKGLVRILKMFDSVIASAQAGQPVDLSDMPPSPGTLSNTSIPSAPKKEEAETQQEMEPRDPEPPQPAPIPAAPTTVGEALQQRLDKYRSVEQSAKDEGNASKVRRFGRIVKQYEDAIKRHKAGKPVPFDELPTPPGFGPIPGVAAPAAGVPDAAAPIIPTPLQPAPPQPARPIQPAAPSAQPAVPPRPRPPPSSDSDSGRSSGSHSSTTLMQKNISILTERQKEFRQAALQAKQSGDLVAAKEYLKQYKQIESMLDVARGGLPVDLTSLPIPPSKRAELEDTFDIITDGDCSADGLGDISERLEQQLQTQLAMCKTTRDHHKAMGDVTGTNRFENLALSVQKDYDIVKFARRKNLPVPKFHYEKKSFDIVKCNTDLAESQMEIKLCRGIGYSVNNPRDVDTFVKVEFPYPQETPFKARSQLVRDTDSPQYDEIFIADIQPKQRHCQRVFKRHAVKFEVFAKGNAYYSCLGSLCERLSCCCYSGFLRSDILLGVVSVKLQPLETVCEIHDSFDIMDGRKTTGGKLEVKIRLRNPILTTQVQHTEEKWLVIDT